METTQKKCNAAADALIMRYCGGGDAAAGICASVGSANSGGSICSRWPAGAGANAALVASRCAWPCGGQAALEAFAESVKDGDFIVIGSGEDVVGRGLGARIDAGEFGRVVRVNKPYGAPEDVGTRTDLLVTRWSPWVTRFFGADWQPAAPVVVLNEAKGVAAPELLAAQVEVGWQHVSAGLLACMWLLNRGAATVRVVGFGWKPGSGWNVGKQYPDGKKDENPHYYWDLERHWLAHNVKMI